MVIDGEIVGRVGPGLLVLAAVQRGDGDAEAARLAERLVHYRVFPDQAGRMNLSVKQRNGGILLVPQFTLAANTRKGTRASFARAAEPARGSALFNKLVAEVAALHEPVATGVFGANMQVELVNDGPVTFWLDTGKGA